MEWCLISGQQERGQYEGFGPLLYPNVLKYCPSKELVKAHRAPLDKPYGDPLAKLR